MNVSILPWRGQFLHILTFCLSVEEMMFVEVDETIRVVIVLLVTFAVTVLEMVLLVYE